MVENKNNTLHKPIFHRITSYNVCYTKLLRFSTRKSGINATTLKDLLELGSYQTAWRWLQKLRTCTIFPQRAPLSGKVEVDEFYLRITSYNVCYTKLLRPPRGEMRTGQIMCYKTGQVMCYLQTYSGRMALFYVFRYSVA